ncbi:MAG: hypothetical protein WDN00_12170, partial [Limisphaerales bacterium]|jgi:hypothetical protein
MPQDKQLRSIKLKDVLEKRRLDQALNAKEFAVAAGISYSTAREWFRLPGFPVFRGVIFWQDFVQWRNSQNGFHSEKFPHRNGDTATTPSSLPPRAAQILQQA